MTTELKILKSQKTYTRCFHITYEIAGITPAFPFTGKLFCGPDFKVPQFIFEVTQRTATIEVFTREMINPASDINNFLLIFEPVGGELRSHEFKFSPGVLMPEAEAQIMRYEYELELLSIACQNTNTYDLFIPTLSGRPCARCWDNSIKRAVDGNCPDCKGTGRETGYNMFPDIKIHPIGDRSIKRTIDTSIEDKSTAQEINFWTLPYPTLVPGAILIPKDDNLALFVSMIRPSSLGTENIRQTVVSTLAPYHEVLDKIKMGQNQ